MAADSSDLKEESLVYDDNLRDRPKKDQSNLMTDLRQNTNNEKRSKHIISIDPKKNLIGQYPLVILPTYLKHTLRKCSSHG